MQLEAQCVLNTGPAVAELLVKAGAVRDYPEESQAGARREMSQSSTQASWPGVGTALVTEDSTEKSGC